MIILRFSFATFQIGSIGGGRWSDHVLAKLKAKNGGVGEPEVGVD
jgi:hypothetical protein